MKTNTIQRYFSRILTIICLFIMYSCENQEDRIPSEVIGTWSDTGIQSATESRHYLSLKLDEDGSGYFYYESLAYIRVAGFTWTFKNNIIACMGTMTETTADGEIDIDSEWVETFKYTGSALIPQNSPYKDFILTHYGSSTDSGDSGNSDISTSSAVSLSSTGIANSYIVSKSGTYSFSAVKGNSRTSVGSVSSVDVLWETFGTDVTPSVGDLIQAAVYENDKIYFKTSDTYREGNAVIAAKNASGTILWSWHIWFTDQPQGQVYYNNAGTMMDRNLGATSATPGDDGALGLLYQWGRKDPFLGSSSISNCTLAKSTITWPSAVSSDASNGTIEYAVSHPATFISANDNNYDWYYTGDSSTDNTRWTISKTSKSIYDPCPAGWRVPDGGDNGIWATADFDDTAYDFTNFGISFSISSPSTTWYPGSGWREGGSGKLAISAGAGAGYYWSASPYPYSKNRAYYLMVGYMGFVHTLYSDYLSNAYSVRCIQESK